MTGTLVRKERLRIEKTRSAPVEAAHYHLWRMESIDKPGLSYAINADRPGPDFLAHNCGPIALLKRSFIRFPHPSS